MVSKPCQDRFMYPVLVKSLNEKERKIQIAKCGTSKKVYKPGLNPIKLSGAYLR
jgi:hypothetical protein